MTLSVRSCRVAGALLEPMVAGVSLIPLPVLALGLPRVPFPGSSGSRSDRGTSRAFGVSCNGSEAMSGRLCPPLQGKVHHHRILSTRSVRTCACPLHLSLRLCIALLLVLAIRHTFGMLISICPDYSVQFQRLQCCIKKRQSPSMPQ